MLHCLVWLGLVGLVLPYAAVAGESSGSSNDKPTAIAVFGGLVTDNNWEDAIAPWDLDYRESLVAGLAISHRIGRFDHRLSFEIEGQVVRHFGDQDHWELNLPIVGRWEAFLVGRCDRHQSGLRYRPFLCKRDTLSGGCQRGRQSTVACVLDDGVGYRPTR